MKHRISSTDKFVRPAPAPVFIASVTFTPSAEQAACGSSGMRLQIFRGLTAEADAAAWIAAQDVTVLTSEVKPI